jgi:phage shock protein PspC (stress-responsive transcriptional regulator)
MKKNITINLCGRLFQIDEDAYELLQQYIDSLHASFGNKEDGEEIANDIEEHIAELFDELKTRGTMAITIEHVKDIITRIGRPEELTDGNDSPHANENGNKGGGHRYDSFRSAAKDIGDNIRARTAGKRLYRNPNDKLLAGVLSGIAAYTGTDATWWRIGYALLLLGSNLFIFPVFKLFHFGGFFFHFNLAFVLFYIVLAIAMPEAKKPKEVLEMEGKDVTPQTLADVVVEDKDRRQPVQKGQMRGCLSVMLKMLVGLFVGIAAIFGLVLLCCFLLIVGTLIFIFTVPGEIRHGLPFDLGYLNLAETFYLHPWAVVVFVASLLLALFIPLYAIVHMLLSKAGKVQPMGTAQRIGWIAIWLIALFSIFPSIGVIRNYNEWLNRNHQAEVRDWMTDYARDYLKEHGLKIDSRHHCYDNFVKSGEYFTGDTTVAYIDVEMWGPERERRFQVSSNFGQEVEKGKYIVSCNARADGGGVCLFATAHDGSYTAMHSVPAQGKEGGLGNGWQHVEMEVEIYGPTTLYYGISANPKFTTEPCHAKWFSAADFKVERKEDPASAE